MAEMKANNSDPSHLLLNKDSIRSTLAFIGPIVALVCSITCLVILNTYLKILKEEFKRVINFVLIYNIIGFSITIAINSYFVIMNSRTFILCSLRMITNSSPLYFCTFGITMMSFLRYHISTRIVNCESTKKTSCYATSLMVIYGVFELLTLGPISFLSTIVFGTPTSAMMCIGSIPNGKPIITIFHFVKVITFLTIGIRYDYLMMGFLQKRNQKNGIGQSRLIPWKSGGHEYDLLIPMSATITSFITSIGGLVVFIIVLKGFNNNRFEVLNWLSFGYNIFCCIQMAIMIGMTIRAAKHKKPAPVIPKGPMYHESLSDIDGVVKVEEDIEMQEVIQNSDENQIEIVQESSSNDSLYAVSGPNIIHVKPMIHNAECGN